MLGRMEQKEILGILRNPWGISEDVQRKARLDAALLIESYEEAIQNLRKYAEAQGIDTMHYHPGKSLDEAKAELLKRVDGLAKFAHGYFAACEVGPERTWAGNLYEIIRTAPREARE